MSDKASSSKNTADNAQMESFQSILKSLNIPDPSAGDNAQITPEMMERLSERIMGLLGCNAPSENASSGVTEDGLPVVDINEVEEIVEEELPPLNAQGQIIDDDIIRHDQLSPEEKARRIAAVKRFLDELEEEEEVDKERERAEARVWAEQKKRESAARAAGGLSAPRAPPRPPSDRAEPAPSTFSTTSTKPSPKPPKKKSVRFKGEDSDSDEEQDSGDLVFARLQKPAAASNSATGLRGNLARLAGSQPMKLDVVERAPGKPKADPGRPSESRRPMPDSDDETPPQTPTEASSDEESGRLDNVELQELREEYERRRAQVSIDPSEIDLSLAGRGGIGSGGWDEENVPLEATLASSRPKPAVSRFKSARMKEGASVSVPEIIPAGSSSTAFTNAIRLGRLQNEELVAAADSDSDEDFERKHAATLEALKNYGSLVRPSINAMAAPPELRGTAPAAPPARAAVGGVRERVLPRQGAAKLPPVDPAADSASTPEVQAKQKKVSRFKAEKGGQ